MTTGTEIAKANQQVGVAMAPEIVLQNAMVAAKALATVLAGKKKPVIMNGEQYLEFEDWQTVGQFYHYTIRTKTAVETEVAGVKGAKAEADLIDLRTGEVIGGAEAYCMRDEEKWNTRPKYEWQGEGDDRKKVKVGDEPVPWFQLASMAQTRAGAKAFRNRLAWVVVLAGYKPTPAEEMTGTETTEHHEPVIDTQHHYCQVHKVNFFKRGKMRGYAHKIEGTSDWCNETEEAKAEPVKTEAPAPPGVVIGDVAGVPVDLMKLEFANQAQFLGACFERFKLQPVQVNKEVGIYDLADPKQRIKAWQQLVGLYAPKPPEKS